MMPLPRTDWGEKITELGLENFDLASAILLTTLHDLLEGKALQVCDTLILRISTLPRREIIAGRTDPWDAVDCPNCLFPLGYAEEGCDTCHSIKSAIHEDY